MTTLYYKEAQKRAQKEFRACTSSGQYPYLPVLDEFLPKERMSGGVYMGVVQIPMEFIVGTYTDGRKSAFARNFMPLVDENSEFAGKWKRLCDAHLDEGIRDPIKVYEYLNRYYVEEGNKRVSVLRFFDAVSVMAQVTRILPERGSSHEADLYYEFVDFYRVSGINYIEFSKSGGYARLQELLGKAPNEAWSDEERRAFSAAYYYFRQGYEAKGGKRLNTTVGDAILAYIEVYGYHALRNKTSTEIKRSVEKVWEEITLQQEEQPIDVKLSPIEKKPSFLTKVLSVGEKKGMNVAFIHDKDSLSSGWTKEHEQGREHIQRVFGEKLHTRAYVNAMDGDPLSVIEQAITDGNTILFTTSPRLLPAALRAAVEHPEVTILNCSLNKPHRYIRTYYARMYEAKFIIGAIAGALAGSDQVGYLCDYPIFGQIAGVNAFALGVQMVNPRAKVYLEWSAVGGVQAAVKRLTDRGIRLISSLDFTKEGEERQSSFGLSLVSEGDFVNLAVPVWQWGIYYESLIRHIQNGSFRAEYEESGKALSYYWGMSAGAVELHCSDTIPPGIRNMAELLQKSIRADLWYPFQGVLYTQDGKQLSGDISPEQIISMDWLVENVEGTIPVYDELTDMGKATVDMVGVKRKDLS